MVFSLRGFWFEDVWRVPFLTVAISVKVGRGVRPEYNPVPYI